MSLCPGPGDLEETLKGVVLGRLWLQGVNCKFPLICVPRSRRRRPGAERPTSLHSPHLRTGGGALMKTRMRMKALQGAAILQVAMVVTSTDWSSNVNLLPT